MKKYYIVKFKLANFYGAFEDPERLEVASFDLDWDFGRCYQSILRSMSGTYPDRRYIITDIKRIS